MNPDEFGCSNLIGCTVETANWSAKQCWFSRYVLVTRILVDCLRIQTRVVAYEKAAGRASPRRGGVSSLLLASGFIWYRAKGTLPFAASRKASIPQTSAPPGPALYENTPGAGDIALIDMSGSKSERVFVPSDVPKAGYVFNVLTVQSGPATTFKPDRTMMSGSKSAVVVDPTTNFFYWRMENLQPITSATTLTPPQSQPSTTDLDALRKNNEKLTEQRVLMSGSKFGAIVTPPMVTAPQANKEATPPPKTPRTFIGGSKSAPIFTPDASQQQQQRRQDGNPPNDSSR